MNINKIPQSILSDLKSRGHTEDEIKNMKWEEAFDEYCNWNGLIGWGYYLRDAMKSLKDASK